MREISSPDNPRYRSWLRLRESSRERRKAGLSILDGVHLVSAYLQHIGPPEALIVSRARANDAEIAALSSAHGMPDAIVVPDGLFRNLSSVATPTGILAVVRTPRASGVPATPGPCVILEDIQDPGNLGSILRSAAAADVKEIYLSRSSVHAWSPRVLRAAMGAHFAAQIYENVELMPLVRRYPGKVVAAVRDADIAFYAADLRGTVALLFGNEGAGLTRELRECAHLEISIPMPGQAESLNVAAAAAVCLFERVRQEAASGKP